jgi:hypothetical protein
MRECDAPAARLKPNRGGIGVIISAWWARVAAAVSVVALAGAATASASASALPGDALYPIKQIGEQVALATARDASAQQDVLFDEAAARLDETGRLLEQGREADAGASALRYSDTLARTADASDEAASVQLAADRARLVRLLSSAPPQAQPGLQRAIAATDRRLERARPELPRPASQSDSDRTVPAVIQEPSGAAPANDGLTDDGAAEEARPEQSHRGATEPKVVQSGQSGGAAVKSDRADEVRPLPAPAVDKPHSAPVTPLKPTRGGRP